MTRSLTLKAGIAVVTAALLAAVLVGLAPSPASSASSTADTVIIELRVWQRVGHSEDVWLSARPKGGRWDTLGTIRLPQSGIVRVYGGDTWHRYGDIAMAGVGLRVWQRVLEPWRIYIQACTRTCPEWYPDGEYRRWPRPWRPLGMVPVPLYHGRHRTENGRYDYVDLDIAVPRGNPGLLADREHLLALRDLLAECTLLNCELRILPLNWDAGTPTTSWEGVAVAGTPPRVAGLNLANQGLNGELWGYLGDLTELTELRLNGNALTGIIPSKLSLLTKLTHVYLAGNDLQGCVPPPLRAVAHNDLDSLDLPGCSVPPSVPLGARRIDRSSREWPTVTLATGTYRLTFSPYNREPHTVIFDVPPERSVLAGRWGESIITEFLEAPKSIFDSDYRGVVLRHATDPRIWLFLNDQTGDEMERSHYSLCFYDCHVVYQYPDWRSDAAKIEQLVASMWVNPTQDGEGEWAWPGAAPASSEPPRLPAAGRSYPYP